jgi:hypothetical protein
MNNSKNNIAWQKIFEKYHVLEHIQHNGRFEITATQINTDSNREARLMTKFDYRSQLPNLFKQHHLSILPISRGSYVIANIETFASFDDNNEIDVATFSFPSHLESIDYNNITSEAIALNCAYISGIIQDFLEDDDLKPTINGRMSSLSFDFKIKSSHSFLDISVDNSQIEIDAGFEGINFLSLIEAKNIISDDFMIRQLYYPYRLWSKKVSKVVKNLFLTYTNGVFHFREYMFDNINYYNSIKLVRQKKYILRNVAEAINLETVVTILEQGETILEPEIPFPQADSFERVINLCELLYQHGELGKGHITNYYDFSDRQTNYYTDAGRYLGLIHKYNKNDRDDRIYFSLTERGKDLFKMSIFNRQLEFVKLIFLHSAFKKAFQLYLEKSAPPVKHEIIEIMKRSNLHGIKSEDTFDRRSSTISGWIKWIFGLIEE